VLVGNNCGNAGTASIERVLDPCGQCSAGRPARWQLRARAGEGPAAGRTPRLERPAYLDLLVTIATTAAELKMRCDLAGLPAASGERSRSAR
jgi:hypothetical protein